MTHASFTHFQALKTFKEKIDIESSALIRYKGVYHDTFIMSQFRMNNKKESVELINIAEKN